jgi:hypothetical protein
MLEKRGLVSFILLGFVTLGIYQLYRLHVLARDVNTMCEGDGKETTGLLLFIIFCILTVGIYGIIWLFMLGDRIQANGTKYGLNITENGSTVLLWYLLGMFIIVGPFVAYHIVFKNVNAMIDVYNSKQAA